MRPSSDAEALATNVECPTCGMAPQHTCVVGDGLGSAATRPHLHRVIEALRSALEAAEKERDELGSALDSALRTSDYGKDKLITVMQRRYGREARQWQANHDQRKTERDAALARVRELEVQVARHSVLVERDAAPRLTKENDALSKVYGVAVCLRTFPVPFDDHLRLVDVVDECRQELHDLVFREREGLECPHCRAGEPSVWDDILFHYAHPAEGGKLKMCHSPWRERCRRCSADVVTGPLCAACKEDP